MMPVWKNDKELFAIAKKELFTALVGDVLDNLGHRHQFLTPRFRPVSPDMVVIGRAMTVLEADCFSDTDEKNNNPVLKKAFGMMFEALDDLKEDEVYICSGSSDTYALWGGLMSTRAIKLNAAGAVVHGYSRDTNEILKLNFPTISFGCYAQDQKPRGKVIDFRCPIEVDGVRVENGDVVYGDRDGVIIVPKELVEQVFTLAIEKARGEKLVKVALENGMSAVDAFAKYGIM